MMNLLRFPPEPSALLGAEHIFLANKKLCRQIGGDKSFMEKLVLFILKNMSAHRRLEEWTGLEWVANENRFLFNALAIAIGLKHYTVGVFREAPLSEDGKEISK